MRTQTVTLSGFNEFEKGLRDLAKATSRNVLLRIGKASLEPLADKAASLAPTDEGKLAFSISVSDKRTRRVRKGLKRKDGVEIAMGPANAMPGVLQYASFVEFGTVDTPPQPFMRPAFNSGANAVLDYIKDNLGDEILKAAAKVAKKRAKAGL
jgi:HK97 gp10 family phage protein